MASKKIYSIYVFTMLSYVFFMFLPLRIYALYIYSIFPPYPIGRISPCDTRGFLDPPSVQEVAEKAKELDHTDAGSESALKNLVVFLGTFGGMKSYPVIWGLLHKPLYNVIYIYILVFIYIYIYIKGSILKNQDSMECIFCLRGSIFQLGVSSWESKGAPPLQCHLKPEKKIAGLINSSSHKLSPNHPF